RAPAWRAVSRTGRGVRRALRHVQGDRGAPRAAVADAVEHLVVLGAAEAVAGRVVDGLDPAGDLEVTHRLGAGVVQEAGRDVHDVVAVRRDRRAGRDLLGRAATGRHVVEIQTREVDRERGR